MPSFPTELPFSAVQTLIGFLRGKGGGRAALLEACYEVLGYGLGVVVDGGPAPPVYGAVRGQDHADYAAALEGLLARAPDAGQLRAGWTPPSWLVPLVLQVLQEVLRHTEPAQSPP